MLLHGISQFAFVTKPGDIIEDDSGDRDISLKMLIPHHHGSDATRHPGGIDHEEDRNIEEASDLRRCPTGIHTIIKSHGPFNDGEIHSFTASMKGKKQPVFRD
jgi:hypothetical protein